jgi:hypothetical protein
VLFLSKSQRHFFKEIGKKLTKLLWNKRRLKIVKVILSKKDKTRDITAPDLNYIPKL